MAAGRSRPVARARTLPEIERRFRVEFARLTSAESGAGVEAIDAAMHQAGKAPSFVLRLDRRVRYWTDGLIIGSEAFVRETAARLWDADHVRRHRLQPARGPTSDGLYACRRLHSIPG